MKSDFLSIKNLPESERPYEKFMQNGRSALTDAELLAVIIKTGSRNERATELAMKVLKKFCPNGNLGELNRLSVEELTTIAGIGRVKAIQILCAAELSRRINFTEIGEQKALRTPQEAANAYMNKMRYLTVEHCYAVMLDTKNRIIKDDLIAKGSINRSMMPLREILVAALKCDAVGIILIHNHPSGDPEPSKEDIVTTGYIRRACSNTGIELIDHIVIGGSKYTSIKEHTQNWRAYDREIWN